MEEYLWLVESAYDGERVQEWMLLAVCTSLERARELADKAYGGHATGIRITQQLANEFILGD